MAMKDYNGSSFKNSAIDRLSGKFGKDDDTNPKDKKKERISKRFNEKGAKQIDKSDKAQEKLSKYVNSTKSPNSTKEMYGQAKQFLGGYYDNKPLNKMTDVDYNDKKTQKFKSMADKAEVKENKISARYSKKIKKS